MRKIKMAMVMVLIALVMITGKTCVVQAKETPAATVKNINITHRGELIPSGTMVYVSCDISANYPIDRARVCFDVYSSKNYLSSTYIDLSYDSTSRKYVGNLPIKSSTMYEGYYRLDGYLDLELDDTYISAEYNNDGLFFRYSDTCLTKGHVWDEGETVKESTCTEQGKVLYTCKICKLERTTSQKMLEHKPYIIEGRAASCEDDGYSEKIICDECNQVLKESVRIPATGHQHTQILNRKEATAVDEGYTGDVYCTDCDSYISYGESIDCIPATGNLSITNIVLKKGKSWTVKVSNLAAGDSVAYWISNNNKVVTVNQNGKVSAKKKGTAKIAAVLESGELLIANVKVQNGAVKTSKVTVNTRNVTLAIGQKYQLTAERYPLTSSQKLTYSSSKKKIATVSKNGCIQAKKKGKAIITVKSGGKKVKVQVIVK